MHIWTKNRWLSIAVAVGYALTITAASLFHNHVPHHGRQCCHECLPAHPAAPHCHHDEPGNDPATPDAPKAPSQSPSDSSHCSVCQFLGQKPAPPAEVTPVISGTLVQEVSAAAPAPATASVFSAWQSRAPPLFA
jgi:hypothetical protein